MCDGIMKANAKLELSLARNERNKKKGFYKYISQKRKNRENVHPSVKKTGVLMTTNMKAEGVNNFLLHQISMLISLSTCLNNRTSR